MHRAPAFIAAKQPKGLESIQHLRAVAALSVVMFHIGHLLARLGYEGDWPPVLSAGVDVFFVISGFIMCISTQKPMSPARFLAHRARRIVPLYWLLTTAVLAVLIGAPQMLTDGGFDPWHVLSSYLFVPALHPGKGHAIEPLLVVGWTLNYEAFFYLLFAVGLFAARRWRFAVLGLMLGIFVLAGLVLRPTGPIAQFYTAPIVLEFLLGMGIAQLYRQIPSPAAFGRAALILGGCALMYAGWGDHPGRTDWARLMLYGLPSALIVAGAVLLERAEQWPSSAVIRLLGDASYSIYLSHGMALAALVALWQLFGPAGAIGQATFFGVALCATTLAGVLVWRWIERPIDRWLRALSFGPHREECS